MPHAAPLARAQPRHPDFTSPAQRALGPMFATGTGGAASCGTPLLPHVVEAGMSQLSITANGATASSSRASASSTPAPSSTTAPVPPRGGGATAPSPFPFGMCNAATYASSSNTNFTKYEDLPGHHLLLIRNTIASSPDNSYPETAGSIADDISFFMDNFTAEEAEDYSGVRDPYASVFKASPRRHLRNKAVAARLA